MKDLLRRLFLVDLLKGMWLTFRYQAPKNIYTEQYPLERPMVAERYRGAPRLNMTRGKEPVREAKIKKLLYFTKLLQH